MQRDVGRHMFHVPNLGVAELSIHHRLGSSDLKRLESYANSTVDYHVVLDILPVVSSLYLENRLGSEVRLGVAQSSIVTEDDH